MNKFKTIGIRYLGMSNVIIKMLKTKNGPSQVNRNRERKILSESVADRR